MQGEDVPRGSPTRLTGHPTDRAGAPILSRIAASIASRVALYSHRGRSGRGGHGCHRAPPAPRCRPGSRAGRPMSLSGQGARRRTERRVERSGTTPGHRSRIGVRAYPLGHRTTCQNDGRRHLGRSKQAPRERSRSASRLGVGRLAPRREPANGDALASVRLVRHQFHRPPSGPTLRIVALRGSRQNYLLSPAPTARHRFSPSGYSVVAPSPTCGGKR